MGMYLHYLMLRSDAEKVNIDKDKNIDELILVYI